jgi:hypothetical protein
VSGYLLAVFQFLVDRFHLFLSVRMCLVNRNSVLLRRRRKREQTIYVGQRP